MLKFRSEIISAGVQYWVAAGKTIFTVFDEETGHVAAILDGEAAAMMIQGVSALIDMAHDGVELPAVTVSTTPSELFSIFGLTEAEIEI